MFRARNALLLLLALAFVSVTVYAFKPRPPKVEGKPVEVWFDKYVELRDNMAHSPGSETNLNTEQVAHFQQVFQKFGGHAVDYLHQIVDGKSTMLIQIYRALFSFIPGAQYFLPEPSSNLERQLQAAELLVSLQDPGSTLFNNLMNSHRKEESVFVFTLFEMLNQKQGAAPSKP